MAKRAAFALSGSGTLTGLHIGALAAFYDRGIRPNFLVGTSGGSIVCGLLSLGYTPHDLRAIMLEANFAKLIPYNELLVPFRHYLANNKNVIAWLKELTHEQSMMDCKVPFSAVTTDLYSMSSVAHSTLNKEDVHLPVWQAIIASLSIPDVFPMFNGRFVDGGVMRNLAVDALPNGPSYALRVTERTKTGPITGWIDEQERLLDLMLTANEQESVMLAKARNIPVINLPAGSLGFLDRSMSNKQKSQLYATGYNSVVQHFGKAA